VLAVDELYVSSCTQAVGTFNLRVKCLLELRRQARQKLWWSAKRFALMTLLALRFRGNGRTRATNVWRTTTQRLVQKQRPIPCSISWIESAWV